MDMDGHPVNGEIRDVNAPLTEEGSRGCFFWFWKLLKTQTLKTNIGDILLFKDQIYICLLLVKSVETNRMQACARHNPKTFSIRRYSPVNPLVEDYASR